MYNYNEQRVQLLNIFFVTVIYILLFWSHISYHWCYATRHGSIKIDLRPFIEKWYSPMYNLIPSFIVFIFRVTYMIVSKKAGVWKKNLSYVCWFNWDWLLNFVYWIIIYFLIFDLKSLGFAWNKTFSCVYHQIMLVNSLSAGIFTGIFGIIRVARWRSVTQGNMVCDSPSFRAFRRPMTIKGKTR